MNEDCYVIVVPQPAGTDLTITNAPSPTNRLDRGVRLLLTRVRVTREPRTITWSELREAAAGEGIYIDPRDQPHEEPGLEEKYRSPIPGLLGLR